MNKILRLWAFLFISIPAFAQTAVYPGAVVTDKQLMVGGNNLTTHLTASINSTANTISVANTTHWTANMLLSFSDNNEIAVVCGVPSGNLFNIGYGGSCPGTGGRGFDGTTATSHANGVVVFAYIDAWHHNALRVELEAIEGTLGANLSKVCPPGTICDASYSSIEAACTAANSANGTLYISLPWNAAGNETLNCYAIFLANGRLKPNGFAVLLAKPFAVLSVQQVFDYSSGGTVRFPASVDPVYPQYWGAKFDNSTNDTSFWQYAIDERQADGGGIVRCVGTSLITGQLTYNYGLYPSVGNPVSIIGSGARSQWFTSTTPSAGGCWMNMTFASGPNGGRIQLISPGSFRLENLVLANSSSNTGGFVKITNTNYQDRDISFVGSPSHTGASAADIGRIWGGQTAGNFNSADAQFAGYGSHAGPGDIFANINKGDLLQGAANGIVIDSPAFSNGNGGDCAILLDGSFVGPNQTTNNTIFAPTIEQTNYIHSICLKNASHNTVMGGGEYDGTANVLLSGVASNTGGNALINYAHTNPTDSTTGGPLAILSINGGSIVWEPQGVKFCAIQNETTGSAGFLQFSLSDNSNRCPLTTGPITAVGATVSEFAGGLKTDNSGVTTDYIAATNGGLAPTIVATGGCTVASSLLTQVGVVVAIGTGSSPCTLTLTMATTAAHYWVGGGTDLTTGTTLPQFGITSTTFAVKGNVSSSDTVTLFGMTAL